MDGINEIICKYCNLANLTSQTKKYLMVQESYQVTW